MAWPPKSIADWVEHGDRIAKLVVFAEEMMRLKVLSNTGGALLRRSPATSSYSLDQRGTESGEIPAIADNAGKFLGTDGELLFWAFAGATLFTHVSRIAAQSIPNAADTAVSFDTANSNTSSLWSAGSPTRITIPVGQDGLFQFFGQVSYLANATGIRYIYFHKNGAPFGATDDKQGISGNPTYLNISRPVSMVAGDRMELMVFQTSGAPLDLTSADFFAIRIGESP